MGDKMLIAFIRVIILYIIIIFSIRLMGKKQIGEFQPSELVITILVSNIATLPIEDLNIPMLMGIIPILSLVSLDVIMSMATLKSRFLRRIVSGSPKIIIRDGVIDQKMIKDLRFTVDDLFEALRGQEIFDISEVQFAIVETTGSISFYQKPDFQPATAQDLNIKNPKINPPQLIIENGSLIENSLDCINKGNGWLYGILSDNNVSVSDVFLMTADETGAFNLIKKENS